MRQCFHSIIRKDSDQLYIGWVEEIPGTLTRGRTLAECRANLRDALALMLATQRDEARLALTEDCIEEPIELDLPDPAPYTSNGGFAFA